MPSFCGGSSKSYSSISESSSGSYSSSSGCGSTYCDFWFSWDYDTGAMVYRVGVSLHGGDPTSAYLSPISFDVMSTPSPYTGWGTQRFGANCEVYGGEKIGCTMSGSFSYTAGTVHFVATATFASGKVCIKEWDATLDTMADYGPVLL